MENLQTHTMLFIKSGELNSDTFDGSVGRKKVLDVGQGAKKSIFLTLVRRSSFVVRRSFVRRLFVQKTWQILNFAKAGARPDGGTARHGRGPSLGKIKI